MLPKPDQRVRFQRCFFSEELPVLKSIRWELLGYKAEKQKLINLQRDSYQRTRRSHDYEKQILHLIPLHPYCFPGR